jgi:hypothetical protein
MPLVSLAEASRLHPGVVSCGPEATEEKALQFDRTWLGSGLRSTATSLLVGLLVFLLMVPVGCGEPSASTPDAENAAAVDDVAAVPASEEPEEEAAADEKAEAGDDQGVSDEDKLSAGELEELVGRIALYPDDLLAQVLPASTYPLDIVEAARFLEKNAGATEPPEDSSWDPSVIALLHFPDVLAMMSDDVAWTRGLGDALWTQEADVYDAIQAFRLRTYAAGNLESDDKVVIVQEKETIRIVPADPQVIYVPVYQPQTVVVTQTSYATPLIVWGTAVLFTAWAYSLTWGGHHHHHVHHHRHYNRHYRNHHYKKHRKHYNNRHTGGSWKASNRPGGGRPGHAGGSRPGKAGLAGSSRPGSSWGKPGQPGGGQQAGRPAGGKPARPSAGKADRPSSRPKASQGSYGSYGRGGDTRKQSARGSQSRQKQTSHTSRQQPRESARSSRGGSYGSYKSGASAQRSSSRGSASRGSAGRGGGGRSRGGGGGRRR